MQQKSNTTTAAGGIPRFQTSSLGHVLSPQHTMWTSTLSVLPVASVTPDIQQDFSSAAATIPGFSFAGHSVLLSVDFALPFRFGDDLLWLNHLRFISEISQPPNAFLDNILLRNAVENRNSGYADFQLGGNTKFNWFSVSISTVLVILLPSLLSMTWKTGMAGRPGLLLLASSPQEPEESAFDVWSKELFLPNLSFLLYLLSLYCHHSHTSSD
jgi:hypothetical protein